MCYRFKRDVGDTSRLRNIESSLLALGIMGSISCSEALKCTYDVEFVAGANAGCLVVNKSRLLIVEDYLGKMALPGGTKKTGEAPQCTAEREVWEETGIEVKARRKIKTFDNKFQVYACDIVANQKLDGSTKPVFSEIERIHWVGIDELESMEWRFPDQVELMSKYLRNHKAEPVR